MKHIYFFIFGLFLLFSWNHSYAENPIKSSPLQQIIKQNKISLDIKNKPLKVILNEIHKKSGVGISFKDEDEINALENLSLKVTNATIEEALHTLLEGTNFTYKIIKDTITIIKREGAKPKSLPATTEKVKIIGTVIDEAKRPIVGATIFVKGTSDGAISDDKGNYIIYATIGSSLEAACVGKKAAVITITNPNDKLILQLQEDVLDVKDVVVTGIFSRKVETYTGSAVTVTGKELKQYGNRNVLMSLRNIDPSFNVVENNSLGSNPNRLPEIQIRGNSSLPNIDELQDQARVNMNTPLVVLDGFEVGLQKLIDMNDNEIESITLLKDASATSIYGSRGANGVIVIVSKAPVSGKLKISYRGDLNIEMPDLTSYSLLNAKEKLDLEYEVGRYNSNRAEDDVKLKQYYNFLRNEVNSGVDTDWLSKPLRTGIGHRHNLRIEGGDNVFRYSASLQYNNIQGVMKKSTRNNINATINLSYFYKNIIFTNNLTISSNKADESPYGSFSTYANLNPYFRPVDENGNYVKEMGIGPNGLKYVNYGSTFQGTNISDNPLYNATLNIINNNKNTDIQNNFSINWKIADGLILKGRIGIQQSFGEGNLFYPAEHTMFKGYTTDEMIMRKGNYTLSNKKSFNYDGSVNLSYSKLFADKHSIYLGADYNVIERSSSSISMKAEGFTNSNLNFPAMALQYELNGKPSGSESLTRSIGMTFAANYTYDNRYYLDISGRLDGSSAFGSNNRFAPFWSSGLGWNLHRESFLKESKILSFLKLRGSVGITGSQNFDAYQALSTFRYYTSDRYYTWSGTELMGLGNPNLRWQQKMNYNLAIETGFLENRLRFTAEVYLEKTKDLISSIEIPLSNGFPSYTENIGAMENRGLELKLTGIVVKNEKWLWNVTGFLVFNENKVTKLSQAMKDAQKTLETSRTTNPNTLYREGYSTDAIWTVPSLGIDPTTGRDTYLTKEGIPTSTWNAKDLAYCGIGEKYRGNITTMLRYSGLTLTMSFSYRFGAQLYNSTLINKVENVNYNNNLDSRVYSDRWKKPGDIASFKGLYVTETTPKTSRFVKDESTFKCNNINLTYEVRTEKMREKLRIENLAISASMDDLFYISTVKRERGTSYPFSRLMSMTLNITF